MSDIYLSLTETPSVVTLSQPVVASVMVNTVTVANVVSVNVVTMPAITVQAAVSGGLSNAELRASAVSVAVTTMPALSISSVSISNFPASQTISGTVTANMFSNVGDASVYLANADNDTLIGGDNPLPVTGTVTVGSSVTISNFPATQVVSVSNLPATQFISGSVTANVMGFDFVNNQYGRLPLTDGGDAVVVHQNYAGMIGYFDTISGNTVVSQGKPLPISGTVTANVGGIASGVTVPVRLFAEQIGGPSSGQDTLVVCDGGRLIVNALAGPDISVLGYDGDAFVKVKQVSGSSVTIGSLPRVTFIDGSGTVVTANSAVTLFASSTTRSYLLVQVTTGSAFVNVGATATTVNGISLTAGQGYAWETTIPQGVVSLISTTTSSRYVAKEA